MAITHYLDLRLGAINLYSGPYERNLITVLRPTNTNDPEKQVRVEIIEEFVYPNCEYTKVKINDITVNTVFNINQYYIKNQPYLKRLPGVPESAPVDCTNQYVINTAYERPEWTFQKLDQVYFDSRELKYVVAISTPFTFLDNQQQPRFERYSKRKGTRLIFEYLSKQFTEADLDRYLNYFIFANVDDFDVSYSRGGRIKALVSIHIKYLDAIPSVPIEQIVGNITDVIKVDTYELNKVIKAIASTGLSPSLFNSYHLNTTNIGAVKFSNKFTFEREAKNLIEFYEKTVELIEQSQASYSELNKNDYIEFAVDSCKRVVYMSHYNANLKQCTRVVAGLLELNQMLKEHRYNSINYMSEIKTIYIINPCDLEFDQFINRFCFFKPTITKSINRLEDLINEFLNSSSENVLEVLNQSLKTINQMTIEQDQKEQNLAIELLGISQQIKEKRDKLKQLRNQTKQQKAKTTTKFPPPIDDSISGFSGPNYLPPSEQSELQTTESELAILLTKIEQKRKELKFFGDIIELDNDPIKKSFMNKVVSLNNEVTKEFVGRNGLFNFADKAKKQAKSASKPNSKANAQGTSLSGEDETITVEWNAKIVELFDIIRDSSFCRIAETILKCLSILLDNLDSNIKIASRKVFTYKELKEQVIPSLTVEQKRIFYNIFITEACINKKAIIEIFTRVTGAESARYLTSLSYQEAKRQLILKLV